MDPRLERQIVLTRRHFFGLTSTGIGVAALVAVLSDDPALLTPENLPIVQEAFFEDMLKNAGGMAALKTIRDGSVADAVADVLWRGGPEGKGAIEDAVSTMVEKLPRDARAKLGTLKVG